MAKEEQSTGYKFNFWVIFEKMLPVHLAQTWLILDRKQNNFHIHPRQGRMRKITISRYCPFKGAKGEKFVEKKRLKSSRGKEENYRERTVTK
jgi:hypothetical protein